MKRYLILRPHTQGLWCFIYLSMTMVQRTQNTLVYTIRVSQGSVATRLRCGGIFNDGLMTIIVNCPQNVPVKEL